MKNSKEILNSTAPFFIVLVLIIITAKFGLGKVFDQNLEVKKLTLEKTTLNQKIKILSSLTDSTEFRTTSAAIALPELNPSLTVVSQLKSLALQNGIILLGIKAGAETKDTSGLLRVDISFEIDGAKPLIINFIKEVSNIAPITLLDKVKIADSGELTRADISVKSFWSPFPKTISGVTESVNDLTEQEVQVLTEIENLTMPEFVVNSTTIENARENPFTQ